MLIKEENGKINFIDKNDNYVGVDYVGQCCEQFGYKIVKNISDFSFKGINWNKESAIDVSGDDYIFDVSFSPSEEPTEDNECYEDENAVAFKIINRSTGDVVYLILYNSHNGCYSHGWDSSFSEGGNL